MRPRQEATAETLAGVGLGLRAPHYQDILDNRPEVDWFEALTDNYLSDGGPALRVLDAIRGHYPISLHGVGLSLGSCDPLNQDYLDRLSRAIARFEPVAVSEHLCFTSAGGHYSHELLPLPYTEDCVRHVAARIRAVQDRLGRRLLIENVSSYVSFQDSQLSEAQFLAAVLDEADCDLLLDLNNLYVSACNHDFEVESYLDALPAQRIRQIHLAGYTDRGDHLLDSHGEPVHPPVWSLYATVVQRYGAIPSLIEWDTDIPALPTLLEEADKARSIQQRAA